MNPKAAGLKVAVGFLYILINVKPSVSSDLPVSGLNIALLFTVLCSISRVVCGNSEKHRYTVEAICNVQFSIFVWLFNPGGFERN